MRNRLILLLLLCATGAAAQIPTLTNSANVKFVQGNTIFDRPVSDILDLVAARDLTITANWDLSGGLIRLRDANTYFYDDGDNTKSMRFQLSGVTTATTRNLTVPNADGTIALTGAAYGGTGQSAVAQGDLLYGSGTDTWARLAKDANATRYLSNTGSSNNPAWAQVNLTNGVTGTLPVGNGGSGAATFTNNRLLTGNGTSAFVDEPNLTFDGTTLNVTGKQVLATTGSYSTSQDFFLVSGTVTSTANSLTHNFFNFVPTFANDGTTTGQSYAGMRFNQTTSTPTAATTSYNMVTQNTNTSANVSQLYGIFTRLDENTTTGDLTTRVAGRFDLYKNVAATDIHTATGLQYSIAENSADGRWKVANGINGTITNAKTMRGVTLTLTNNRGTTNTQTGLELVQNVSGSGVVVDNAFGIDLYHTESSSGSFTNYYAIRSTSTPSATTSYGLYFSGSGWRNYLNGGLSLGVDVTTARLFVRGSGTTSSTYNLITEKSDGTDILLVRDDGVAAIGTTPVSTEKLLVRGATSDNTTKAFVAERASGTDVLGVQNDGKVSINNAAYTEALTISGDAQMTHLVLTNVTASNVEAGHLTYTDHATHGGYLTLGDGDRQLALMPTMIERHVVDYGVDWTTGRKGTFWTVPARFDGWKISKVYIGVTSIGSGAGDDEISIEVSGVVEGAQIITAGSHTLVMDEVINTDDIVTFNITSVSATAAKGLNVALELSKN